MRLDPRGAPDLSGHDYAAEAARMYERGKLDGAADRAAGKAPNHYLYVQASPDYSLSKGYREGYGCPTYEYSAGDHPDCHAPESRFQFPSVSPRRLTIRQI